MKRTIKIGPEAWAIDFKEWEGTSYVILLQRTADTQIETVYDVETFENWVTWLNEQHKEYQENPSVPPHIVEP